MEFIKSRIIRLLFIQIAGLFSGGPSICMDFGHFTLKRDTKLGQNGEGTDSLNAPKVRLIRVFFSL